SAAGYNFGWDRLEGSRCYPSGSCDPAGTVLPALEYTHSDGLSVTGGFVYRGEAIPELTGRYFYADWVGEWIRSFRFDGATVTDENVWTSDLQPGHVTSFGVDNSGELYITTWFNGPDGALLKIVPIR
ncbi:MAG: glucose dehydrogenase, partial [Acidimicrobiia bacterium]